jgi:hypothetical protein
MLRSLPLDRWRMRRRARMTAVEACVEDSLAAGLEAALGEVRARFSDEKK